MITPTGGAVRRMTRTAPLLMSADDEVAQLKAAAERLRSEVAQLEQDRDSAADSARAAAFAAFDKNKDGSIEPEELRVGLSERFGLDATAGQLEELFKEFDSNNDGVLQLDEFQLDMLRGRLESLQRTEKEMDREQKRLAMEAKTLESQKNSLQEMLGEENMANGVGARAFACLPYILPLCDAAQYGRFILTAVPLLGQTLAPLVVVFRAVPFGGLLAFWVMTTQSRNRSLPRLVRFNLQQAVLLDIALFFPSLLGALFAAVSPELAASAGEPANDLIFVAVLLSIGYSCAVNLATGKLPNGIPVIGENTERSIGGPFDDE